MTARAVVRDVSESHGSTLYGRRSSRSRRAIGQGPRVHSTPCEESSVPPATCRSGGSSAREIAKTFGSGGGKGTRSVASYDEDTTTMGVEAARLARRSAPDGTELDALWFSTANPAYLDKNNASAIHAALRLDAAVARGRLRRRAAVGRRRAARRARRQRQRRSWSPSDIRAGLPDQRRRVAGRRRRGRARRRLRRRRPGHRRVPRRRRARPRSSSTAGARPGSRSLTRVGRALRRGEVRAARRAGVERGAEGGRALRRPGRPARSSPACTPAPCAASRAGSASSKAAIADDLAATVGNTGTAHAALLLDERARVGRARPGDRARRARRRRRRAAVPHDRRARRATGRRARSRRRSRNGGALAYGKFLSWRGSVTLEPPRRPEPDRISASVSGRTEDWKYGVRRLARPRAAASCTCRPRACRASATRSTTWMPAPMADVEGTIALFTDRPHRVLAEPADHVRGRRLRRRRPPPGRAHRRRRRRAEDRRPGRDDVPQAVHRRRHPQLLLEGPARSGRLRGARHGFARHQGPGRDRRHGLHAVRRALGQGHRRPADRRGRGDVRVGGHRQGRRRRVLARHRDVGHERHGARPAAAAARQAGDARRELLRDRVRGVAQRGVRGGERRVRHRDGDRRREGEGQRLPGPRRRGQDADRRHRPHAHRGGDVRDVRARLRQEVRRRRRADARGARPHRVEEPLQRRPQPACAVPARKSRWRRSAARR